MHSSPSLCGDQAGKKTSGPHYLIFILSLSILALFLLALQVIAPIDVIPR